MLQLLAIAINLRRTTSLQKILNPPAATPVRVKAHRPARAHHLAKGRPPASLHLAVLLLQSVIVECSAGQGVLRLGRNQPLALQRASRLVGKLHNCIIVEESQANVSQFQYSNWMRSIWHYNNLVIERPSMRSAVDVYNVRAQ